MRVALVLAAGLSRRFGRADKLLAPLHGRPLLLHAIDRARASGVARVYVVVSSRRTRGLLARDLRTVVIARAEAAAGLSASLAAGLRALRPIEREALIFLGDMPWATLPRGMRLRAGLDRVRPMWRGIPGHPVLVRVAVARGASPDGDRGLGALRPAGAVRGRSGNVFDIDSPAALRRARIGSCVGARRSAWEKRMPRCSKPPPPGSRPPRR